MTVRVNKSSFNIREKLSELGRKFGLKGSELAAAETVQEARDLVSAGRKNLLINGAMTVNQRNGGSAMTATTAAEYCLDRWRTISSASSKFTVQRVNRADTTPPEGFSHSMKITSSAATSVGANDYYIIQQRIEGNTLPDFCNSQTPITISFWVRSSLTGIYGGAWTNVGYTQYYPFQFTINNVNTWEYKTITVPGSGNNYIDGNSQSAVFMISLGSGTTYSEPVSGGWTFNTAFTADESTNFVGTSGAVMYLTGVQAEVGRNATEFEHRSYGEELALCQRYYQRVVNTSGGTSRTFIMGGYNNTRSFGGYTLSTPMRSDPAVTINNIKLELLNLSSSLTVTQASTYQNMIGSNTQGMEFKAASGITGATPYFVSFNGNNSYIAFDAEL